MALSALSKGLLIGGAVSVAGTFAWVRGAVRLTSLQPAAEAVLRESPSNLRVQFSGLAAHATLQLDGRLLPVSLLSSQHSLESTVAHLADGEHVCALSVQPRYGFEPVQATWRFFVDSRPPGLQLYGPKEQAMWSKVPCQIAGHTEPGARVTLALLPPGPGAPSLQVRADARGGFQGGLPWREGPAQLVVQAQDRVGNQTTLRRRLFFDKTPPSLQASYPAPEAVFKRDPTVTFRACVKEEGSGVARATLQVDELPPRDVQVDAQGNVQATAADLVQGRHRVLLKVVDRAGLEAQHEWRLLVDTSETFGEAVLGRGAVGKDVGTLQRRLERVGLLPQGSVTHVYNDATEQAVRTFQMRQGINVDGLAGYRTLGALSPRIHIDLAHFSLELRDQGRLIKRYRIAHGQPAYPTPVGTFRVTFLQKDPTWLPPRGSLWAREAKVMPPGPGNPLGTRWIGLNSSCVGIHGTNAEWTVGTRASHGCVRMRIRDVEDLYARINLGCEVTIAWKQPPAPKAKPLRRRAPVDPLN